MVIGWSDTFLFQEDPEGIYFPEQPRGKDTGFILSSAVANDELDEPRIECPPLSDGRGLMCHVAKTGQFCECSCTESCEFRVLLFGNPPGIAD